MANTSIWKDLFRRQNCLAHKIDYYISFNSTAHWANLMNISLEKCVKYLVNSNFRGFNSCGTTRIKYYSRNIINQWITRYHYPSINFECDIDLINAQFERWYNGIGSTGVPVNWNVFNNIKWTSFFSFMKSIQHHIKIIDVLGNLDKKKSILDFDEDFTNLRDFTWKFLVMIKSSSGSADSPDELLSLDERKRPGIGYLESRLRENQQAEGWIHTGALCKKSIEKNLIKPNRDRAGEYKFSSETGEFIKYIYAAANVPAKIDMRDLPVQCDISGSTNAILSTILWCTSDVELTENELKKIILGIFSLLCLDGGHTVQEVLSAECLISNFYMMAYNHREKIAPETQFNLNYNTLLNLYKLLISVEFLPILSMIDDNRLPDGDFFERSNLNINTFENYRPGSRMGYELDKYKMLAKRAMGYSENYNLSKYYKFWIDSEDFMNDLLNSLIKIEFNNRVFYNEECDPVSQQLNFSSGGRKKARGRGLPKKSPPGRGLPIGLLRSKKSPPGRGLPIGLLRPKKSPPGRGLPVGWLRPKKSPPGRGLPVGWLRPKKSPPSRGLPVGWTEYRPPYGGTVMQPPNGGSGSKRSPRGSSKRR
jgi:hypothetical protein